MRTTTHHSRSKRHHGLSLVEVLVCGTISALLMLTMGMTYLGSFNSFRDSQERGDLNSMGRGFVRRITADIRMSDAHGPWDPTPGTLTTVQAQFAAMQVPGTPTAGLSSAGGAGVHGVQMVKTHPDSIDPTASPTNPVTITYWFDPATNQVLTTRQTGVGPATTDSVCSGVQNFQVYLQPVYIPANPATGAKSSIGLLRAVVKLTLANKDPTGQKIISNAGNALTITMTDAAMPRRGFATQ